MSDACANALAFASDGQPVLPIFGIVRSDGGLRCACGSPSCSSPGKHPLARLVPAGVKNATTDVALIEAWNCEEPDANWAVATGGLIVVDQDGLPGAASLGRHLKLGRNLPETWTVSTGRTASRHYYYATDLDIGCSAGKLGKGLDIRGRGGYAVIAGSRHVSGHRYEFHARRHPNDAPMAKLPAWIADALREADTKAGRPIELFRRIAADGVGEGERHVRLTQLAGHLVAQCVDPLLGHELLQAWNIVRCRPPLPADEVERIVSDIVVREVQKRTG